MPTLDDAVNLLDSSPSPAVLGTKVPVFAAAFSDIQMRLQTLERASLEAAHRLSLLEAKQTDFEARVVSVETDRAAYGKRVDEVAKVPGDNATRLAELEKRIRTVEGAVGAKAHSALKPAVQAHA